jgi:arylsulfatase
VTQPVSTLGVFATVLDLAGIEPPPTLQVGSLVPLARGESRSGPGPILSELHVSPELRPQAAPRDPQMHYDRRYRLLREGSFKLIETSKGETHFYDLSTDPGETHDLAAERTAEVSAMQTSLAKVEQEIGLPALDAPLSANGATPELDPATREHLRALGYTE